MVGFSLADLKRTARQAVHDVFAVPALYSDSNVTDIGLHVRWHGKVIAKGGNIDGAGYAEVFEGVNRLLFSRKELETRTIDALGNPWGGVTLEMRGSIAIPAYGPVRFSLDTLEPADGPVNVLWNVARADL